MSFIRGFLPWIGFAAISPVGWQWGAAAAALIAVVTLILDRRAGTPWDCEILSIGALTFFLVLTPVAFAAPHGPIAAYCGALSSGWLALVAWVSIAADVPFTTGFAKRQAPAEFWATAAFRRLNVVITAVWAIAFTVSAAVSIVIVDMSGLVHGVVMAVAFIAPAVFTRRYVAAVRTRRREAGEHAAAGVRESLTV